MDDVKWKALERSDGPSNSSRHRMTVLDLRLVSFARLARQAKITDGGGHTEFTSNHVGELRQYSNSESWVYTVRLEDLQD